MSTTRFFYSIYQGPKAVIFLHGLGGDLTVWKFLEKTVTKKGLSFLAVDLPGHGYSAKSTKNITVREIAQWVKEIADRCGYKQYILIGHCFGGMAALEFASLYKKNTSSVILIASNYFFPPEAKLLAGLLRFFVWIKIGSGQKTHRDFDKFLGSSDFYWQRIFWDIYYLNTSSYISLFYALAMWKKAPEIDGKKIVIIAGKKDTIFPPEYQRKMNRFFKGSRLIFIKGNHLLPINSKKKVKKIISSCLKEA